jgi:phosphoglycerol geranylgeranyltransferase
VSDVIEQGRVESFIIRESKKRTLCAALIDPEDLAPKDAARIAKASEKSGASVILIGGSTISDQSHLDDIVRDVKAAVTAPTVLFPGNITGVSRFADAILFSSLLNSNNPYFIIGAQALGAMQVYKSKLETIPMGYLVFGNSSTTSFIAHVNGIPHQKPGLAVIYALAAKYLGMRSLYLEAGSGSTETIPEETIKAVRRVYDGILIVGGGINSPSKAREVARAGANMIVIGNMLQSPGFELKLREITKSLQPKDRA